MCQVLQNYFYKLTSSAGASYNLDDSRARAYCACSRCGRGFLDIFTLLYLFSSLSPSLWETARYRLKYCLKGPINTKQPTNYKLTLYSSFDYPQQAAAVSFGRAIFLSKSKDEKFLEVVRHGWLVGCFGFNGPLRQYFSLYRAISQREGERGEKG